MANRDREVIFFFMLVQIAFPGVMNPGICRSCLGPRSGLMTVARRFNAGGRITPFTPRRVATPEPNTVASQSGVATRRTRSMPSHAGHEWPAYRHRVA